MTVPPDPQPDRTPGLEAGGGVPPGETPPDSASATQAVSFHEPDPPRMLPMASVIAIVVGAVIIVALAVWAALDLTGVL
ncbi:DUF6480 family protein [Kutzneria kofuensis]|uniref:Uncharacterized protein n=1 Tax=Kutzneria kofuensis TaxID=103725 RepID=A0A7W9KRS7_9PSEU|nr:DUF6480 family protein [Kutzneria kofuensis]MBB5897521.1 hypothetical protein [Kutzneria kofuensis]